MLKELLWSYRQLFLPGVDSADTSEPEYARYMREAEQAYSALEAAFKHRREFRKEMLQDMSEGVSEIILKRLIEWTHDIAWPSSGDAGFWKSTATTADECCEKTSMFMQDRHWPFTKIVRIYINSKVLKTGLVLADLPGLQDTNLARVRATQEYLLKCNTVFLVTNISRAITDQSLKSSLYKVLSQHLPVAWEESGAKGLRIAVVCTRSEEINMKAARNEFFGSNKPIAKAMMEGLDYDMQQAKSTNDAVRKKMAKWKQQTLLMEARNKYVTEGLQNAYAEKVPNQKLEVFCVSNVMYEKYAQKGNVELVRASCIPELRQFCYGTTADAQFREASHSLRSLLLSLLNSLELYLTSGSTLSQKQEYGLDSSIYQILDDVAEQMWNASAELRSGFDSCFKEQILQLLDKRRPEWEKVAAGEGRLWTTWHWSQYYAFCLHNGHHETPKRPREDWNAKLLWKMRMELEFQWDIVEDEIPAVFESLIDTVKSELEYLKDQIQNSAPSDTCDTLLESIDARIRGIEYSLELLKERFAKEVRLIRSHASETNSNSFIFNEMIPGYRSACSLTGPGRAKRQTDIVQGRIENGTLFPNIGFAIANRMEFSLKEIEKDAMDILQQQISQIRNDLDLAIASQQQSRSQERAQRKQGFLLQLKDLKEQHFAMLESIISLA
ncbi:hypothetical protein BKA67DRAFT_553428 [Truncatella angustata]|uniref:DUF7605 domain-containing protein n=1 Tax=Truncatella angustata TaxID=152316 RepID=A0A9P9A0A5_9PEZI|nr:uncharacterized protein BKA67DRAFT_553428 [Truncatella angustata]KAH6656869.1 hypothetical protein BKA67DRAFT_553428 [Truncatella angustata]